MNLRHLLRWGMAAFALPAILAASGTAPVKATAALNPVAVKFKELARGLSQPVFITNAGDGSGRIFIVERGGTVRIVKDGILLATPFLSLTVSTAGGEQGLLGLAFHPQYETNGRFFVAYTVDSTWSLRLSEFEVSLNPDVADATEHVILTIPHGTASNHNGGSVAFGVDGYLYWSTGDGGDTPANAQDINSLLGKVLRLDMDSTPTLPFQYAVPPTNPFVGNPGLDEIWAYGLRNPWRISFDRLTHDMYIGDVGQATWEEIDFQPAASTGGENYGWAMYEGNACYSGSCVPGGKTFPVVVYAHTVGSPGRCSVSGGYAYRGSAFPILEGYYFYGDYCSGEVFYDDPAGTWTVNPVADGLGAYTVTSFGEDEQGEIYVARFGSPGRVYRITYAANSDGDAATDAAVFEKATGNWFVVGSDAGFFAPALNFGNDADYLPVPGDYDGDARIDPAVIEKATGNWFVVGSQDGFFMPALNFGNDADYTPVPADYDGDGRTDPAVFEKATGNWFAAGSQAGFLTPALNFGNDANFIPVPGDYDGDTRADAAVFEKATGDWFVAGSQRGFFTPALNFGDATDYIPVPGFYDGDVRMDPGLFQKVTGNWFAAGSTLGFLTPALGLGNITAYVPQPGDYDGDGRTDPGVYERATGNWFALGSTSGFLTPALAFGNASYLPVVPLPR